MLKPIVCAVSFCCCVYIGAETVAEFFKEFNHVAHSSAERIVFLSPGAAAIVLVTV